MKPLPFKPTHCRPSRERAWSFAENMHREKKPEPWWVIPLCILLLPLGLVGIALWCLYSLGLYVLVWICWITRGKIILFVYSDSPHWKEYIEGEILPRIKDRAVILNWSERRKWIQSTALGPMLFRHFGGYRKFNPIGFRFRLFWNHRTYRFWEPLRKWRKKEDREDLDKLLARFYADLGI